MFLHGLLWVSAAACVYAAWEWEAKPVKYLDSPALVRWMVRVSVASAVYLVYVAGIMAGSLP